MSVRRRVLRPKEQERFLEDKEQELSLRGASRAQHCTNNQSFVACSSSDMARAPSRAEGAWLDCPRTAAMKSAIKAA